MRGGGRKRTAPRRSGWSLLWMAVLIFAVLGYVLIPMFHTLREAVSVTEKDPDALSAFRTVFTNPNHLRVTANTILLGVLSVVTCAVLGISFALYMTFVKVRFKRLVHILLLSPMMIPGVIITIAFIQLYGESGILTKAVQRLLGLSRVPWNFSGLSGILFVVTFTQYVYFYLNVYVALRYVDYSAIEAARCMGAGRFRIFRDVIWPGILPACLTSATVTFASGISSFSAPNLIGGGFKVLSTQIVRSKANNNLKLASAQVTVLFVIGVSAMLLIRLPGGKITAPADARSVPIRPSEGGKSAGAVCGRLLTAVQLLLVLLPSAAIIYLSFNSTPSIMKDLFPHDLTLENYMAIAAKPRVLKPVLNSLKMSAQAVGMALLIAVPSAAVFRKYKGKDLTVLRLCLMLPWIMPASVSAINLINAFSRRSVFAFGHALIGTYWMVPVAYTVTSVPLLLSSCEVAFEGISDHLEEASASLGAGPWHTFVHALLPNVAPGVMAGAVLVFIRLIGEYTMSALLYGVYNRPISISMVTCMQEFRIGVSMAYGVIVMAVCSVALAVIFRLDRKRFM